MSRFQVTARFIFTICFTALCAMGLAAQSQPDSQAGAQLGEQSALAGKQAQGANTQKTETSPSASTSFVAGTLISAELTGSLDSKKVKQGDAVNARTTVALKSADGRTILPQGTKVTGHITQASARSAGQPDSTLGLFFDKAVLKNGEQINLNAAIQAVGAPPSAANVGQAPDVAPMGGSPQNTGAGTMNNPGSGMGGTRSGTPATAGGGVEGSVDPNAGAAANTGASSSSDQWNPNTRGVVGLSHLSLSAAGGSNPQGSVIASTGKNVHLDSGTRLILVTQAPASN
jgi:hypothetical protein